MARQFVDSGDLTKVADAIRTKGGTTAPLQFPDGFVTGIRDVPGGAYPNAKGVEF